MAFGNAGRRLGGGERRLGDRERPLGRGTVSVARPVQQGFPTRTGWRETDGTDRAPERGYQDEIDLRLPTQG